MSDFGENPFGVPGESEVDPFQDPSIQQVKQHSVNNHLDNYNPYPSQHSTSGNNEPAVMQPTQDLRPPSYAKSGQQSQRPVLNTQELQRRQEELDKREKELDRREQEMHSTPTNMRLNNWPPLPEQCCFQPCFYQDIQVDIRIEFQKIVRHLYYLWIFHGCVMLLNVLGGLILLITVGDFTTLGLGILYALLFTPFSFICWFRPAYKAFRSDSSFNYMVFFFVFFFQFVVTVIQTIGIPGSGTCGIILALKCFDKTAGGVAVGVFLLIIALMFGTAAGIDLLLITKIHAIYRSSGASVAKAKEEFTNGFLQNEHVQNAGVAVAASVVQSQRNPNRY